MKWALISDIHANLEALKTVFRDIEEQKVDAIHCLGDVIGYGCDPVECLDLVTRNCDIKLMGNHEYVALGLVEGRHLNAIARSSTEWTRDHLADRELAIIAEFEMDAIIDDTYLVHASPNEPDKWHYLLRVTDAEKGFECLTHPIGFFGHSHMPAIFSMYPDGDCRCKIGYDIEFDPDNRYLVNVGSVGQPRDNDPRACYLIYDSDSQSITYRRMEYNIETTQKKMIEANIHQMLVERLVVGR